MSDTTNKEMVQQEANANEPEKKETQSQQYTVEELTLMLAKANAEKTKYKNSIDKLTHENSELNKWKRERMTAQEQQDEADAEAKAQQESYIRELESYKAVNETMKRYLGMKMGADLALATAQAEVAGDMDTVMQNVAKHQQKLMDDAKAEWLKSRPDIADGSGQSSITKEDFEKMNLIDRTKLFRSDPETYKKLINS